MRAAVVTLVLLAACGGTATDGIGSAAGDDPVDGGASSLDGGLGGEGDSGVGDGGVGSNDGGPTGDGGPAGDGGIGDGGGDGGPMDGGPPGDGGPIDGGGDGGSLGPISGGPCISGASGQTAYRMRWAGSGSGSTAYPVYEINGLPDTSRDKVGAYGYQIGFSPVFVDPFLGEGGLQLNSSSFVDIELSTAGLFAVDQATLSIYGRSYNTTASGSFNWQTFDGTGSSPSNSVSNSAPYQWYSAEMTTEISANDDGVLLRIKAGPSSGSLVVNRIEICMQAQ